MAKKALLDVLEQTIGKYVKNLDAESLNVAVWSGKIELHSLQLDVQAVNSELDRKAAEAPNLAIPFKLVSGSFESLQVDVPWAQLTGRSVVMRARGLKILVEPFDRLSEADHLHAVVANESKRAVKVRRARKEFIESSEKYRLQANAVRKLARADNEGEKDSTSGKSASGKSSSFASRLVRRIIENIQIDLEDIHVCLKDSDGSAGVVLESLSLVTTDKAGNRTFVDRTTASNTLENSFLYKALTIKGLGLYLDHIEMANKSLVTIDENNNSGPDRQRHSYVLAPLSFKARLRQADGNVCIEHAKYQLGSELSSLSIILSRNQLDLTRKIMREVSRSENAACPLFPEYRPLTRVTKESAAEWWKYAVRCIGRLNGRRSWAEFFIAFQLRKKYIPLYRRDAHHRKCPWIQPLTEEEYTQLKDIEQNRTITVEGIMAWRNVADAQVEKELEKHKALRSKDQRNTTGSLFTSIFGSKESASITTSLEDEPPIHLDVNEMKDLEAMSLEDFSDAELSSDSKLCNVKFLLSALKINLTSYDLRNIAALEMGTVSVHFHANADGAYSFEFTLSALEIKDMVTTRSVFQNVLRNVTTLYNESDSKTNDAVFRVNLEKGKSGDQKLLLKLAAFEAVASPILFREVKNFFALSPVSSSSAQSRHNPILAQSLSGSVDLFYDADEGTKPVEAAAITETGTTSRSAAVSELSHVLIDAWKAKTETKASWVMDIDIKAPLVVIPETCTDPRANVLVFDFGHLKLQYGKIEASQKVIGWLESQANKSPDSIIDSGRLEINDLKFLIGKADCWRRLIHAKVSDGSAENSAVVEPISVLLNFGMETRKDDHIPRICCFGVVPSISLRISPSQAAQGCIVLKKWRKFLDEMKNDTPRTDYDGKNSDFNPVDDVPKSQDTRVGHLSHQIASVLDVGSGVSGADIHPLFYVEMGLQRLSLAVVTSSGDSLEANLVSVYASMSSMSDGSNVNRLRMGWFWILDRMKGDFVRRQRLVAHSKLPLPPDMFAKDDMYNILGVLTEQGVFDKDSSGSNELADITLKIGASKRPDDIADDVVDTILDAKFSSLAIHWNPYAVKNMNGMINNFALLVNDLAGRDADNSLIVSPAFASSPAKTERERKSSDSTNESSRMLIKAQMESLSIYLNSARDDFPLFVWTMSSAQVKILSSHEFGKDMVASLVFGDLSLRTPEMGQTKSAYRTLIGLAPGRSESLLTVKYCVGLKAIESLGIDSIDTSKLEACAEVELSPMRLVYLHSQVLTLVDYITEGVLGALAARAASSAAEAAKEIANSVVGEKFFIVKATAIDVLLPQAAHSDSTLSAHAGTLHAKYRMFSDPGGGEAEVSLSDVLLKDSKGTAMQENPIRLDLNVILPPLGVGSLEDQAMRVVVDISQAAFALSKPNYAQLLRTLDQNIGDEELYLRNEPVVDVATQQTPLGNEAEEDMAKSAGLTHAGVAEVDKRRRMHLNVRISVLALQLSRGDLMDPIVRIAAVSASVALHLIPDENRRSCELVLGNLVCEDRRVKAAARQYRFLIDQGTSDVVNAATTDLFYVQYESDETMNKVDLKIGTPQIAFIPDAIADVLDFLRVEDASKGTNKVTGPRDDASDPTERQVIRLDAGDNGSDIETTLSTGFDALNSILNVSIQTNRCRFILVDLGSQCAATPASKETVVSHVAPQLAETIVIQGVFAASLSIASDVKSREMISAEFQGQGDSMEVFSAFGSDLKSPLQILDPAEFSAHGSLKTAETGAMQVEVRAAALTPFEVVFSMHNAALLNAILCGLTESLVSGDSDELNATANPLNDEETERIEQLAHALGNASDDSSILLRDSSRIDDSSSTFFKANTSTASTSLIFQLKLTMPETRVTVVNDLQGLDEALFRVTVANFVAGGELKNGGSVGDRSQLSFDFHLNTSILADYFDSSMNLWNVLLTKPWEMTLKGKRTPNSRFGTKRHSTTVDLESYPCCICFSEQFLVSLAGANRMWSIYTVATTPSLDDQGGKSFNMEDSRLKQSIVASAARNLVMSLPYAVENHSGLDATFLLPGAREDLRSCHNGTVQYFRFEPPRGSGYGGRRLYGQDVSFYKSVTVFLGDSNVQIRHLDSELGCPRRAHDLGNGRVVLTHVVKKRKTIVLYLTSYIEVHNRTCLDFDVSVFKDGAIHEVGACGSKGSRSSTVPSHLVSPPVPDGRLSKPCSSLSIPLDLLRNFSKEWTRGNQPKLLLVLQPNLPSKDGTLHENTLLQGRIDLAHTLEELRGTTDHSMCRFEVTCRTEQGSRGSIEPLVVQVSAAMTRVDEDNFSLDVFLDPRAVIENKMPIGISLRTPMPHTFSSPVNHDNSGKETTYELNPDCQVEVFTPGPSIAVTTKTTDTPVAGTALGWMDGGWIDLPLVPEFRLPEPLACMLPFSSNQNPDPLARAGARGSEFFIAEGVEALTELTNIRGAQTNRQAASSLESSRLNSLAPRSNTENLRAFFVTVCDYAVDHTGDILFEQVVGPSGSYRRSLTGESSGTRRSMTSDLVSRPFSAFASFRHRRRISLLPTADKPLRILQLTMEGDQGLKKSMPFLVENIAFGTGGIDSTSIFWDNKEPSGYFAYRKLLNEHQSELHVIPEYIVFNGSSDLVLVKERRRDEVIIEAGKVAPLGISSRLQGLELSFNFVELGYTSPFLAVENLGMKVAIVNSQSGFPVGRVYVQTVIDTQGDSRLVVKIGDVNLGAFSQRPSSKTARIFEDDNLRFRVRWTELQVTLKETLTKNPDDDRVAGGRLSKVKDLKDAAREYFIEQAVTTVLFSRFTVDYQRIFKEDGTQPTTRGSRLLSPERAQISVIVNNLKIRDDEPNAKFPIIFDSTPHINFLDVCIRLRGPSDADLVKVDLFDLNLSHQQNGKSGKLVLNTSEDFLWKLIDLANRIIAASEEFGGSSLRLEEDKDDGGYIVSMVDTTNVEQDGASYTPPKGDKLFDIKLARVSPFTVVISFRRNPQASRYRKFHNSRGANIMNYFTKKLKFKLENAQLNFARYENRTLKGPPDQLLESLRAVYLSRTKLKLVTLISAASFQDWKFLAARDDGDDEYVEGDILRVTGNLAGKTAGHIFKQVGKGLGHGVSDLSRTLGDGIEKSTEKIGVGKLGVGVNSVVSGVGDGVGDTIVGVGTGAGKLLKGASQGIGHVVGGVTGGAILVGKGIGKGIVTGDGKAVVSGLSQGASSIGGGVGQGVESAVMGAADGVLSAGQGLFSGFKSVGRGIGGAFQGKKPDKKPKR